MPEFKDIDRALLRLDAQNPRLAHVEDRQAEAIHKLWGLFPDKLLGLASDIVAHGMDPSARLIVVGFGEGSDAYTVLEGNRRVAALRALDNPAEPAPIPRTHFLSRFLRSLLIPLS